MRMTRTRSVYKANLRKAGNNKMVRIFGHYIPRMLFYLGMVETGILWAAMYAGVFIRFSDSTHTESALVEPIFPRAIIFVLVMIAIMTALGLYQRELREGEWGYFPRLGISFLVGLAVMSSVFYILPSLFLGRGAFGLTFLVALAGISMVRFFYLKLAQNQMVKRRILMLGMGSRVSKVEALEKSGTFQVVGYLPLADTVPIADKARVLSPGESLESMVKRLRVEEIVVALRDRRRHLPIQELLRFKLHGVAVIDLSGFFERETGRIQLESLNPSWLIFGDGFQQGVFKRTVKRLFDIGVSSILLITAAPIMILTALLIYREDKGPIFYRQERVGQNGSPFALLKFRSMRLDAEGDGIPKWAQKNDDRITRVGRIIRKTRVDELPQVFNVLKGNMSFVGPRPERPYFVEQLCKHSLYYSYRHAIKPGVTGWAQVRYPYGASIEDAIEKLQYDLYYVKNNSLFLDMIILFQTARVLLWNDGAR